MKKNHKVWLNNKCINLEGFSNLEIISSMNENSMYLIQVLIEYKDSLAPKKIDIDQLYIKSELDKECKELENFILNLKKNISYREKVLQEIKETNQELHSISNGSLKNSWKIKTINFFHNNKDIHHGFLYKSTKKSDWIFSKEYPNKNQIYSSHMHWLILKNGTSFEYYEINNAKEKGFSEFIHNKTENFLKNKLDRLKKASFIEKEEEVQSKVEEYTNILKEATKR